MGTIPRRHATGEVTCSSQVQISRRVQCAIPEGGYHGLAERPPTSGDYTRRCSVHLQAVRSFAGFLRPVAALQ